jgi:CRP-like cAMP-binding protein
LSHYPKSSTDDKFFGSLSAEDRCALAAHTLVKDYAQEQHLFWAGDEARNFYVVLSGRVKLYLPGAGSRQSIINVVSAGDILGLVPAFESLQQHVLSAEALTPTSVLAISMRVVKERISLSDAFREKMAAALAAKVRGCIEGRHILSMPAPVRVAWLLVRLSRRMLGKGGCFQFPYEKSIAAVELGMSQETFSRALTQLQSLGVTRRDAAIDIDNFDRLHAYIREGGCRKVNMDQLHASPEIEDLFQGRLGPQEGEPGAIFDQSQIDGKSWVGQER